MKLSRKAHLALGESVRLHDQSAEVSDNLHDSLRMNVERWENDEEQSIGVVVVHSFYSFDQQSELWSVVVVLSDCYEKLVSTCDTCKENFILLDPKFYFPGSPDSDDRN